MCDIILQDFYKDLCTENRGKLHFSHVWKICIQKKQATEVVLVGWFGKCQSIKKVGGRRFVEGLYQALFSFRLARRNVIFKAKRKIEPDLRLILPGLVGKIVKYRALSEPIRLQDLEVSARSQAWKK